MVAASPGNGDRPSLNTASLPLPHRRGLLTSPDHHSVPRTDRSKSLSPRFNHSRKPRGDECESDDLTSSGVRPSVKRLTARLDDASSDADRASLRLRSDLRPLASHPASPGRHRQPAVGARSRTISSGRSRTSSLVRAAIALRASTRPPRIRWPTVPRNVPKVWRSRGRRPGVCGSHPIAFAAGRASCRLGSPYGVAQICPTVECKRFEGECLVGLPGASL